MQAFATVARVLGLGVALLLLAGCATDPGTRQARSGSATTEHVVQVALDMRGQPYRWGGESPGGFDCSGLVHYAYAQAGLRVPRTTDGQYDAIRRLYLHQLAPGDLVFFRTRNSVAATHVGIFIGGSRFVHALNESKPVHISRLDNHYWRQRVIAAGSLVR